MQSIDCQFNSNVASALLSLKRIYGNFPRLFAALEVEIHRVSSIECSETNLNTTLLCKQLTKMIDERFVSTFRFGFH